MRDQTQVTADANAAVQIRDLTSGSQEVSRLIWEVKVRGCPKVRALPLQGQYQEPETPLLIWPSFGYKLKWEENSLLAEVAQSPSLRLMANAC